MRWGAAPVVDRHHIDAVLAIEDPVARNQAITATYHALALALREVVSRHDATWCAFAVWASRTAGVEIAMETVAGAVRRRLDLTPLGRRLEHTAVLRLVDAAVGDVSRDIAEGNTMVFAELAPVFVALLEDRRPAAGSHPRIVEASALYTAASRAADPRRRAQLVLHANLVAVLHEQERLQGPIRRALDAVPTEALHGLARRGVLAEAAGHVVRTVEQAWEEALTERFMTLVTADEVLHLSHDVPSLPGQPLFPDDLTPPFPPGLDDFCRTHDTTGLTGVGSGARDWCDLAQRMTYILNLFRSRQRHPALFAAPS